MLLQCKETHFTCTVGCQMLENDFVVLDNPKWIVLVGNWNAILDPKTDRVGREARGLGRRESSLINFMACHDFVDRFHLDHPGREMWTWLDSLPAAHARLYLDSVRRADTDFLTSPHFVG